MLAEVSPKIQPSHLRHFGSDQAAQALMDGFKNENMSLTCRKGCLGLEMEPRITMISWEFLVDFT